MIVLGDRAVHTANNTDYQLVAKSTPNFTPKNVKLGVVFLDVRCMFLSDMPLLLIQQNIF
jgi:hypothetical protein